MHGYEKYIKELEEKNDIDTLQDELFITETAMMYCTRRLFNTLSSKGVNIQEIREIRETLAERYENRYQIIKEAIEIVKKRKVSNI